VDLEARRPVFSMQTSGPDELSLPLRWVGLAASRLSCDIAASTGIHDAEAVVKVLMMGASVAQVASVLYRRGPKYARTLRDGLAEWMDAHQVRTIGELRGAALRNADDLDRLLTRLQYVRELERAGAD
jgi:dihydroorotate dehydrogenase (fumarate)